MGLSTVLQDDFSQGYKQENWGNPFHGGTYWNGAFAWSHDDVKVQDGTLNISMTNHGDWWSAGGLNSFKAGKTITYGTIEFDARVPEAQGTMAALLTWPATDTWPRDGEIDILETPHAEQMFSTHYASPGGEHWYDSVRSDTYDETQWHHYAVEWLPNRLTIKVDGQVKAEWTDPSQIPDVAHGIGGMGFVGSHSDQWMGGAPDGSTPAVVTAQMDNIVMKQWDGQGDVTTGGGSVPVPPVDPVPVPTDPVPPSLPGASPVVLAGEENVPDVFTLRPGEAEARGSGYVVEGFEVGFDKLDVAPHTIGEWTYDPWAEQTADGTLVHLSWNASESVLLKGVQETDLHALTHPAFFEPDPEPTDPETPVDPDPVDPEPEPDPDPVDPDPVDPDPVDPEPADRPLVEGGNTKDTLTLSGVHGIDVDMGDGKDRLTLGEDHSDVAIFLDAGEVQGDRIAGFAEGDLLMFRGYGQDGEVEFLAGDKVQVSGNGHSEVFRLEGYELTASDYVFV